MILYFLMERAKGTKFTKRLGDSAYVFWKEDEIKKLLNDYNCKIIDLIHAEFADFYICESM